MSYSLGRHSALLIGETDLLAKGFLLPTYRRRHLLFVSELI